MAWIRPASRRASLPDGDDRQLANADHDRALRLTESARAAACAPGGATAAGGGAFRRGAGFLLPPPGDASTMRPPAGHPPPAATIGLTHSVEHGRRQPMAAQRRSAVTRRRLAPIAGGAAVAACRPGGAPPAAAPALKRGIILQMGSTGADPLRVGLHARQAQLFTERFPEIKVEVVPDGESLDKIQTTIAAGAALDLVAQNTTRFSALAALGAVLPLDALIQRDRYDLRDFLPLPLETWHWRGKRWGLPNSVSMNTPFLNLTLTEEAGARRPPDTWTDRSWDWNAFLEFCRKTTRREGERTTQWGYAAPQTDFRQYMAWVWSNGGDFFDKDLTRVTLGEPPAVEGLQFHADLATRHRVMPTPAELAELGGTNPAFQRGQVAIGIASNSLIANNRLVPGLRWTLTAIPRGAKGAYLGGSGSVWLVLAPGRYHDETWELLKTVAGAESQRLAAVEGHFMSPRRAVMRDPAVISPAAAPGADTRVLIEGLETALHIEPLLLQGAEIYGIVDEELKPVWAGERAVRDATTIIKSRVDPLLAKERA